MQEDKSPFNPRNPETYQYATDHILVIDGIQMYNSIEVGKKKEITEISEKNFIKQLGYYKKTWYKSYVWKKAIEIVKPNFWNSMDKEPQQDTPGYVDKAMEVYNSMLEQNPNPPDSFPEALIDEYIKILKINRPRIHRKK